MDITITIRDAIADEAVNFFADREGYQPFIVDPNDPNGLSVIPNPQTKLNFAKKRLKEMIKEAYVEGRAQAAAQVERTNSGGNFGG